MGWLDDAKKSISSAWETASTSLFGDSEDAKVLADFNRAISVLVVVKAQLDEIRQSGRKPPSQLSDAYLKLHAHVSGLITAACIRSNMNAKFELPSNINMGTLACVTELPYATWRSRVQVVQGRFPGGVNGLGQLGVLPLIPIVVAIVVASLSAASYAYFRGEGYARMQAAQTAADTAETIARAVADGTMTASDGQRLLNSMPKPPSASGGIFDTLGKTVVLAVLGIGGAVIIANKVSQRA